MKFKVKRVFKIKSMKWEWMWTMYARNGRVIGTSGSESYKNLGDCISTINLIKGSANRAVVEIIGGEKGKTKTDGRETN